MNDYLPCCRIINIHGFRGTLKAESLCDSPSVLAKLKTVYKKGGGEGEMLPLGVIKGSVSGKFVLLTLSGIDSEEKANAMRGATLYAQRKDIPLAPGAAFLADMIGLSVIDARDGRVYGRLKSVQEGVATRIYEIATPSGIAYLPEVGEFIDHIDCATGIYVTPIPGIFDDAEEIRD